MGTMDNSRYAAGTVERGKKSENGQPSVREKGVASHSSVAFGSLPTQEPGGKRVKEFCWSAGTSLLIDEQLAQQIMDRANAACLTPEDTAGGSSDRPTGAHGVHWLTRQPNRDEALQHSGLLLDL
jgi:hypothetical protein